MPSLLVVHLKEDCRINGTDKLRGAGYATSQSPAIEIKTEQNEKYLIPWQSVRFIQRGAEIENLSNVEVMTRNMFPVEVGAA